MKNDETMNAAAILKAEAVRQSVERAVGVGRQRMLAVQQLVTSVTRPLESAEARVMRAREALDEALAAYRFELTKFDAFMHSTSGNPGLMMKLHGKAHDEALRALLKKVKGWEKLRRDGASDDRILMQLRPLPEFDHTQSRNRIVGGATPRVWIDAGWDAKPTFEGKSLVNEIRRLHAIGNEPPETTPPPKDTPKGGPAGDEEVSKKQDAGETPAPKATRKHKPSTKASRRARAKHRPSRKASAFAEAEERAFGEWLGQVNHHDGYNLRPDTANPGTWRSWFENGIGPERAVELHQQLMAGSAFKAGPGEPSKTPAAPPRVSRGFIGDPAEWQKAFSN